MNLSALLSELGTTASMMANSNLSDILVEQTMSTTTAVVGLNLRVNFIKFLISVTDGDLTQRLDPKKTNDAFNEWFKQFQS